MTPQRDPATVRAVLNKHTNDNDRPSACETCCLADELRRIHTNDSADDCRRLAAAIVQDGRWYWVAACDNERHMAEALAKHVEHVAVGDEFKLWEDVVEGPRLDGWTWHGKVA